MATTIRNDEVMCNKFVFRDLQNKFLGDVFKGIEERAEELAVDVVTVNDEKSKTYKAVRLDNLQKILYG